MLTTGLKKWYYYIVNKQTILIVDDDVLFVQALEDHILEKGESFNIIKSYDGKKALEILEKEKIDLVLLDINMPVLDGIQFLTEIHSRKIWLPVIILTNILVFPNQSGKIFEDFGIVAYVEKPVNLEELDKKMMEVLRPSKVYKEPGSGTKFKGASSPKSDFIRHIEAELEKLLGNIAKDIINKKIKDLGFNEFDFPGTHTIDLVEKVCEEIKEKSKLIVFKKKMIEYFKKHPQGDLS